MTQIEALTAALVSAGLTAKAWKGQRIYINGLGRDMSAYIALDEPDAEAADGRLFDGCALKVYSSQEVRSSAIARAKQVKHGLMETLSNAGITAYLGTPCERWQDVIL